MAGQLPLDQARFALFFDGWIWDRGCVQQYLSIGMQGLPIDYIAIRHLHDLAEIHDDHASRDMADHREVMGDEEIGKPEFALQVL